MARLRVGVFGLSHDHVWPNLAAVAASELGRLVAAADPDPRLRERLGRVHGDAQTHATYDALLERRDLDAVFVFADNRTSAELGRRALGRGLPVMIEKCPYNNAILPPSPKVPRVWRSLYFEP